MVDDKLQKELGRPTAMTTEVIEKLEYAFSMGCTDVEACLHAGIDKATLYRYQNSNPKFCDRKEALKEKPVLKARSVVMSAMDEGDSKTAQWYLERKKKDEFSSRVEQTGADGEDLHQKLTPEELAALTSIGVNVKPE